MYYEKHFKDLIIEGQTQLQLDIYYAHHKHEYANLKDEVAYSQSNELTYIVYDLDFEIVNDKKYCACMIKKTFVDHEEVNLLTDDLKKIESLIEKMYIHDN